MSDRGRVHLTDMVVAAIAFIALVGVAPVIYDLVAGLSPDADPFSTLLLQLLIPVMVIGLIVSIGISAERRV